MYDELAGSKNKNLCKRLEPKEGGNVKDKWKSTRFQEIQTQIIGAYQNALRPDCKGCHCRPWQWFL